jgi:hypothetical protein
MGDARLQLREVKQMSASEPDWDNPDIEQQWVSDQREDVLAYLSLQGLEHGRVGEWPAWHTAPYVAVWAVESLARPDWIGWWAISGDLPTDCISSAKVEAPQHPRKALRAFAECWGSYLQACEEGREPENVTIGDSSFPASLAPLLESRAALLLGWAEDDLLWEDE